MSIKTAIAKDTAPDETGLPTLHLLGLPHTQLTRDTVVCAFTAKAMKLVEMMKPLGYDVVSYWGDQCEADVAEHVELFTSEEQREWFGDVDANVLPTLPVWDGSETYWQTMTARAILALEERVGENDLILALAGWNQKAIMDAFPWVVNCEWAAGYPGWCSNFVCFESYAWMHHCYGARDIHDGRNFDTVIPNFFRPDDFAVAESRDDYLLYVGRLIGRKGIMAAWEIARASGRPLVMAGSGARSYKKRVLTTFEGLVLPDVEYVGPVGAAERNALMASAACVLAPTAYIEPFGAVAVEAQLCGSPALTTDFGAFPETVEQGVGGFRFRTRREALDALDSLFTLPSPEEIRAHALRRFSLEAVAPRYDRWFKSLCTLKEPDVAKNGWYA
jgi:hypothetical protein